MAGRVFRKRHILIGTRVFLAVIMMAGMYFFVRQIVQSRSIGRLVSDMNTRVGPMGAWFVRNQTQRGDFVYEQYAATGDTVPGNNIVRQAGALYALAKLYRHSKKEDIRETLDRGIAFFRDVTVTPSSNTRAVQYDGEIRSNTIALLILAMAEYLESETATNADVLTRELSEYAQYLVLTQVHSGGYINAHQVKNAESDYNNGETMYALIRSYEIIGNPLYLTSVRKAADYAMQKYGIGKFNASFYSWGMAAFAYLYGIDPQEAYWTFMKEYTDRYMETRGKRYEQSVADSALPKVPPGAAVFLEGVVHVAWAALYKDQWYARDLRKHIDTVLPYLIRYEINSPFGWYLSHNANLSGAVCSQASCETTRIDFTQHLLSAILLRHRFLDETGK